MPPVSVIPARLAAPPLAAAPPMAQPSLSEDIDGFFIPPLPQPPAEQRARLTANEIDWSQDTIVIWVPGTNGHDVNPEFAAALKQASGLSAVRVRYQSTWRLIESVADGEAALTALLHEVKRRKRPGQRVVLIGESQGAWIISSILRQPELARLVSRASLLSHPSMSPAHVHESTSTSTRLSAAQVREFNSPSDVATTEVGRSAEQVVTLIDALARFEFGTAIGGTLRVAVTNPGLIQALVASQMFRLRGGMNPHNTADFMRDAVTWLVGDAARARAA